MDGRFTFTLNALYSLSPYPLPSVSLSHQKGSNLAFVNTDVELFSDYSNANAKDYRDHHAIDRSMKTETQRYWPRPHPALQQPEWPPSLCPCHCRGHHWSLHLVPLRIWLTCEPQSCSTANRLKLQNHLQPPDGDYEIDLFNRRHIKNYEKSESWKKEKDDW